jgi:hypothetical protein
VTAGALPPPARTSLAARAALTAGGLALLLAVLLALSGLVRGAFYDTGAGGPAAGVAAKAEPNLLGNVSAIDRNVKHLRDGTGTRDGAYGANLAEINRGEASIPSLASSTTRLYANVRELAEALAEVSAANERIGARMAGLTQQQARAAAALERLAGRTVGLVELMRTLAAATAGLQGRVARIQGLAGTVASDKLPPAVSRTNELNALLPARIPPKRFEPIK